MYKESFNDMFKQLIVNFIQSGHQLNANGNCQIWMALNY